MFALSLPKLDIGLTVIDKNNRIVLQRQEEGHSWTRNAWNFNFAYMANAVGDGSSSSFGSGQMTAKDTSGAFYSSDGHTVESYSSVTPYSSGGWACSTTGNTFGILAGLSDKVFDIDDYKLDSLVPHGSDPNNLQYQAQPDMSIEYNAATKTWKSTHSRTLLNSSGGTVIVKEIGLVWRGEIFSTSTQNFLMARDVLAVPVEVPDGNNIIIDYIISADFSLID